MHSISCSFYLFVLPSISSRALSSLALASYSSSMNSCCRFLPERKKSHRQSFATQRKGQIWQCFCHCLSLKIIAPWADSTASYILSYGAIHPKFYDQSVLTPETYPKFTCTQLKSSISDLPGRKEQGNDSPRVKKKKLRETGAKQTSLFYYILKVVTCMKQKQYNTEKTHLLLGKSPFQITRAKLKIKLNTSVQRGDKKINFLKEITWGTPSGVGKFWKRERDYILWEEIQ